MKILKPGTTKWWHGLWVDCPKCECRVELDRHDTLEFVAVYPGGVGWYVYRCPECKEPMKIEKPARTPEEVDAKMADCLARAWKYPVLNEEEAEKERQRLVTSSATSERR